MFRLLLAGSAGVVCLCACGGTPAPPLNSPPAQYLLTIDQLVAPDFMLDVAPHAVSIPDLAAGDGVAANTLRSNHFEAAASEEYFRNSVRLSDLNGPAQIRNTVEVFGDSGGAAAVFDADTRRADAVAGVAAISTGQLGDAAHAWSRVATLNGPRAVEITVEWRVQNIIDLLVVRGREGGTRANDALLLAHLQTASELGVATARPTTVPSPAASAPPPR